MTTINLQIRIFYNIHCKVFYKRYWVKPSRRSRVLWAAHTKARLIRKRGFRMGVGLCSWERRKATKVAGGLSRSS